MNIFHGVAFNSTYMMSYINLNNYVGLSWGCKKNDATVAHNNLGCVHIPSTRFWRQSSAGRLVTIPSMTRQAKSLPRLLERTVTSLVGGEHRCPCCRGVTRSPSTAVAATAGYTGVSMGCVFGPDFFEWVFEDTHSLSLVGYPCVDFAIH